MYMYVLNVPNSILYILSLTNIFSRSLTQHASSVRYSVAQHVVTCTAKCYSVTQ